MRISISGTGCQGKTTLIQDFLQEWPGFSTPKKTYRSKLKKDNHSKDACEDSQWDILNFMLDQLQEYKKGDNIIFDRCPLDNLVYTSGFISIPETFMPLSANTKARVNPTYPNPITAIVMVFLF